MAAKDNLLKFIEFQGIKKSDFYRVTGLSNGFLDKNANISSDKIEIIISSYPDINLHWLITGKGDMMATALQEDHSATEVIYKSNPRDIELIETQRKLIHSLESRLHEVEKRGGKSKGVPGLHSAPTASSHSTDYSGNETK